MYIYAPCACKNIQKSEKISEWGSGKPHINPSSWEAESSGSLSLTSAWYPDLVPRQPEVLYTETLLQTNKNDKEETSDASN